MGNLVKSKIAFYNFSVYIRIRRENRQNATILSFAKKFTHFNGVFFLFQRGVFERKKNKCTKIYPVKSTIKTHLHGQF